MQTEVPNYVAEFQRWHAAAGSQKQAIVIQQAMAHIDTGPGLRLPWPDILNVITSCGKRFGDCKKKDLEAMAEWHSKLVEASIFMLLSGSPQ
jgi:hypothetical protein